MPEYYEPDIETLDALYRLYHKTLEDLAVWDFACRPKCSDCCTCNVTLTSLESAFLFQGLDLEARKGLARAIAGNFPEKRFIPKLTLNGFAACCVKGQDVPPEENDPSWGRCPLLREGLCSVYSLRPFGCRSMVSEILCAREGEAQMPPLVLTVNHIFAQCIEDLDAQGVSGNLADLARLFLEKETVRFSLDELTGPRCHTIKNSRIPALMVPVEHRQAVAGILEKIRALT